MFEFYVCICLELKVFFVLDFEEWECFCRNLFVEYLEFFCSFDLVVIFGDYLFVYVGLKFGVVIVK